MDMLTVVGQMNPGLQIVPLSVQELIEYKEKENGPRRTVSIALADPQDAVVELAVVGDFGGARGVVGSARSSSSSVVCQRRR